MKSRIGRCVLGLLPLPLLWLPGSALAQGGDEKARQQVERALQVVEYCHRLLTDPMDLRACAAAWEYDRRALLDFVRDQVRFVPYEGVLRGPGGTLMARAGNSLDQALLLQALLESAGEKTRLVQLALPDHMASGLVSRWLARDPVASLPVDRRSARERRTGWSRVAQWVGIEPERFSLWLTEKQHREEVLLSDIQEAATLETARLMALLTAAGVAPRSLSASRRSELTTGARDHFWVQIAKGAEWEDMDPVLHGDLAEGLDRSRAQPVGSPAPYRRALTIDLVLTRKAGGKRQQVVLLRTPFTLEEVAFKGINLTILPDEQEMPPPLELLRMKPADRVRALDELKVFRAELHVDGRVFGGVPFDLNGQTFTVSKDGRIAAASGLGGAIGGVFGRRPGGDKDKPQTEFLGLDLVLALRGPGGETQEYRRNLLPPADSKPARRPLPLLRWSLLVQTQPVAARERHRRMLGALLRNLSAIRQLLAGKLEGARLLPPAEIAEGLLRFADYRTRIMARLLASRHQDSVYLQDRPNLFALTWQFHRAADGQQILLRRGLDILDNGVTALSRAAKSDEDGSFEAALALGVADTALESFLLIPSRRGEYSGSAWNLMARARLRGMAAQVAEGGPGETRVSWPGASEADAWWSVEVRSGVTVGRVPSGAGQGYTEAACATHSAMSTICDVTNLANVLMAGDADFQKTYKVEKKVFDIVCGLVGGNLVTGELSSYIGDLTNGAWQVSINALAGAQ